MRARLGRLQPKLPICVATLSIFVCAVAGVAHPKKNNAGSGVVLVKDQGKLTIRLDGKTVGHEEFEVKPEGPGWLAKGMAEIKPPQGVAGKVTGSLTLQPNGAPISYEWTSQAEKTNGANIVFDNGVAKMTLQMQGGRPFDQTFTFGTPLIAVLDNNLYYQYGVLARLYDWSKRGPQAFPVFIPQELMPGTITAEATGSASLDGQTYESFRVNSTDLEVDLYLDASHRLMRLEVPTAKVSVVRE
jgi:hypothetical protein